MSAGSDITRNCPVGRFQGLYSVVKCCSPVLVAHRARDRPNHFAGIRICPTTLVVQLMVEKRAFTGGPQTVSFRSAMFGRNVWVELAPRDGHRELHLGSAKNSPTACSMHCAASRATRQVRNARNHPPHSPPPRLIIKRTALTPHFLGSHRNRRPNLRFGQIRQSLRSARRPEGRISAQRFAPCRLPWLADQTTGTAGFSAVCDEIADISKVAQRLDHSQ
jgi:hypothetical protein